MLGLLSVDTQKCPSEAIGLHYQVTDIKDVLGNIWCIIIQRARRNGDDDDATLSKPARLGFESWLGRVPDAGPATALEAVNPGLGGFEVGQADFSTVFRTDSFPKWFLT